MIWLWTLTFWSHISPQDMRIINNTSADRLWIRFVILFFWFWVILIRTLHTDRLHYGDQSLPFPLLCDGDNKFRVRIASTAWSASRSVNHNHSLRDGYSARIHISTCNSSLTWRINNRRNIWLKTDRTTATMKWSKTVVDSANVMNVSLWTADPCRDRTTQCDIASLLHNYLTYERALWHVTLKCLLYFSWTFTSV